MAISQCEMRSVYDEWRAPPTRDTLCATIPEVGDEPPVWTNGRAEASLFEYRSAPMPRVPGHKFWTIGRSGLDTDGKIGQTFDALARTWRDETQFMSSTTDIAMHPAYQRIIGMGPAVIPHLLRELQRRPEHWFWALRAITGADPVTPEERGKVRAMAEAWLRWGRDHGFN